MCQCFTVYTNCSCYNPLASKPVVAAHHQYAIAASRVRITTADQNCVRKATVNNNININYPHQWRWEWGGWAARWSSPRKVWLTWTEILLNTAFYSELGTRQCFSFATTTTRQSNAALMTRKHTKKVKASVSKWSSNKEYRHNTIINNFVVWKHGHVVKAVLSHLFWLQQHERGAGLRGA